MKYGVAILGLLRLMLSMRSYVQRSAFPLANSEAGPATAAVQKRFGELQNELSQARIACHGSVGQMRNELMEEEMKVQRMRQEHHGQEVSMLELRDALAYARGKAGCEQTMAEHDFLNESED